MSSNSLFTVYPGDPHDYRFIIHRFEPNTGKSSTLTLCLENKYVHEMVSEVASLVRKDRPNRIIFDESNYGRYLKKKLFKHLMLEYDMAYDTSDGVRFH